jgi:hypothetical protein
MPRGGCVGRTASSARCARVEAHDRKADGPRAFARHQRHGPGRISPDTLAR